MTLIVEDGTGLDNADSYVSTTYVDQYAANFGYTNWASLDQTAKEVNARKATRFFDSHFAWTYSPKVEGQSLVFPALCVYVRGKLITDVPSRVKDAVSELAVISSTTDLEDTVEARSYKSLKEKIGDLETVTEYFNGVQGKTFPTVDSILAPLLSGSSRVGKGVSVMRISRI